MTDVPALCLARGYEMAEPTFVPVCTLPKGHPEAHNWAERLELRDRLRNEASQRKE